MMVTAAAKREGTTPPPTYEVPLERKGHYLVVGTALVDGIANGAIGGAQLTSVDVAGRNGMDGGMMVALELERRGARGGGDGVKFDLEPRFTITDTSGLTKVDALLVTWNCPALAESLCCGSVRPSILDQARANGRCRSALGLAEMLWNTLRPTEMDSDVSGRRDSSILKGATRRPGANSRSALKRQTQRDGGA